MHAARHGGSVRDIIVLFQAKHVGKKKLFERINYCCGDLTLCNSTVETMEIVFDFAEVCPQWALCDNYIIVAESS